VINAFVINDTMIELINDKNAFPGLDQGGKDSCQGDSGG
jgi:hypothetical protein